MQIQCHQIELLAIVKTYQKFKRDTKGPTCKCLLTTNKKNLIQDFPGLSSNRMYQLRLWLEKYGPKIVYIKGIHNTVADAISWLGYDPSVNQKSWELLNDISQ